MDEQQYEIVLSVSDQSQLKSLERWLRTGRPLVIKRIPGTAGEGEQGVLDALTVIAGSGGVIAAIKVLPEFIRSKRSDLSITMTVKGQQFTLTASNVDEVLPLIERLLDA